MIRSLVTCLNIIRANSWVLALIDSSAESLYREKNFLFFLIIRKIERRTTRDSRNFSLNVTSVKPSKCRNKTRSCVTSTKRCGTLMRRNRHVSLRILRFDRAISLTVDSHPSSGFGSSN